MSAAVPTRPVLRWHGGKWTLAPWIIEHFPPHRTYVEPFGGAASVLLRKPRSYAEVYNDLDGEAVNLFRVLRDNPAELIDALRLTPFARSEFDAAYAPAALPVERARNLVIRSFMGFGSDGHNGASRTGFRANSNRSGTTPARDWAHYPDALAQIVERLRGVVIENRDAARVMESHDGPETLHYVDPPYLHSTRESSKRYTHEMSDAEHAALADTLHGLRGMVVLSGYESPMYSEMYSAWRCVRRRAFADGARERTEALWLSPAADRATKQSQLFTEESA